MVAVAEGIRGAAGAGGGRDSGEAAGFSTAAAGKESATTKHLQFRAGPPAAGLQNHQSRDRQGAVFHASRDVRPLPYGRGSVLKNSA